MATHCRILPGESYGWRHLVDYSSLSLKESDRLKQQHTHSSQQLRYQEGCQKPLEDCMPNQYQVTLV